MSNVQGLRNAADFMKKASGVDPTWLREAADEIERLREQLEKAGRAPTPATEGQPQPVAWREAAAAEISTFVKDLVKQWVDFRGHETGIAAIIAKHSPFASPPSPELREALVDLRETVIGVIEAFERNSASAPVVECLRASLIRNVFAPR